jgi:hypothetical protein
MPLPLVAILCPRELTFSDPAATVERGVLAGTAEVRTIALDFTDPLPEAALARMCSCSGTTYPSVPR